MPNTRKKVIKTVYKDDESSENEGRDFSDSGSEAVITDDESSDDEEDYHHSSEDDFQSKPSKPKKQTNIKRTMTKFTKSFINKINKQDLEIKQDINLAPPLFSVKDLSDADKLLPSVLNLSESDSSDDESASASKKNMQSCSMNAETVNLENEPQPEFEYKDVWAENIHDDSEEIAKTTFMKLEEHKSKIEETKLSIQNYKLKNDNMKESEVKDLLALGEDESPTKPFIREAIMEENDSEMEDWEEVKDVKGIPQQGLQLIVGVPDGMCRKSKKVDIEMMMKRKMNRVKKEYQVYMHKVHVLCWLGHGNYVSQVLNNQEILSASLSLVPSKECYPGERVDMKYVEQITNWYKDKVILKQDKHENKFKPKAPPLKELLLQQIKSRVFTTKKYMVFVFVSMLRSLGLQCRAMFNFVTLPIRPPSSELCSLSTKEKEAKASEKEVKGKVKKSAPQKSAKIKKEKIEQLDGNCDSSYESDNIMQIDGNDDNRTVRTRRQKKIAASNSGKHSNPDDNVREESVSPPKRARTKASPKAEPNTKEVDSDKLNRAGSNKNTKNVRKSLSLKTQDNQQVSVNKNLKIIDKDSKNIISPRKTRSKDTDKKSLETPTPPVSTVNKRGKRTTNAPKIIVTTNNDDNSISSKYFEEDKSLLETKQPGRKRSRTSEPKSSTNKSTEEIKKQRTRSAHNTENKSKYFDNDKEPVKNTRTTKGKVDNKSEDKNRVSHKDLAKQKMKSKNDVTSDLVTIIKERVKEAKDEAKKGIVKGKIKQESEEDSDYLPVESPKRRPSESDDDFKPAKINPKLNTAKKIDRRVLSTDDELPLNKIDVWCEVFVEELEEWVAVDIIKGKVHCVKEIYNRATHPVNYVVGWDNNNYLKDLTRRYVPHWNTVTRKQRVEAIWWEKAIKAWLGPKSAKDREEDERLDRMQLEAPLPKSIAEYKNHPLYALKRHLLKFEAIYPPDAATLGFVRGEAVYARDCVYVCRSRDTWLKEAKVVRLGEHPYKVVKARPKWDKLSNKLITDKPLEIFGPWQVQDYEPPVAENGVVPRNPYGNVELFKDCMLPKGTVHIKLPGLSRVAKKLDIDCAPAMTGFEFNGGWSHPVYDGFVVCQEFEQVITEAWLKDQEEQERKEIEKTEARVYGNWKKLIRGLLIKERLKAKYGFEEPSTSNEKKSKGPRLVVKKK